MKATIRPVAVPAALPWYQGITHQQWLVLVAAFLGWVFDSMDANMYALILFPALSNLLHTTAAAEIGRYGGFTLALQLTGWALGGIIFGIVADYIGRTRTMILTILIYALFTGLAALSQAWWHLAIFRFVTGLGVGGEWATGVALIAETWPDRSRSKAMVIMQCAFGAGIFLAAFLNLVIGPYGWRYMFLVGIVPAFITLFIRRSVEEPERWIKANQTRRASTEKEPLTFIQLFNAENRRSTFVGLSLAIVGIMGYMGSGNWLPSWVISLARESGIRNPTAYVSYVTMMLTAGSIVGYLLIGFFADLVGRRWTFGIYFLGGLVCALPYFFFPEVLDAGLLAGSARRFLHVGKPCVPLHLPSRAIPDESPGNRPRFLLQCRPDHRRDGPSHQWVACLLLWLVQ